MAKSWRVAALEEPEPKSTEEIAKEHEHEYERTFLVDSRLLAECVELPTPWLLVQAYFDAAHPNDEVSARTIPAREAAYWRRKSITYDGVRAKISAPGGFVDAVAAVYDAPRVALKARHLVRDEFGRAWLVDYFPDGNIWVAETEFPDAAAMKALKDLPEWITTELTGTDEGYTRTRAKARSKGAIDKAFEIAYDEGSRAMYRPSEESGFQWVEEPSTWKA